MALKQIYNFSLEHLFPENLNNSVIDFPIQCPFLVPHTVVSITSIHTVMDFSTFFKGFEFEVSKFYTQRSIIFL